MSIYQVLRDFSTTLLEEFTPPISNIYRDVKNTVFATPTTEDAGTLQSTSIPTAFPPAPASTLTQTNAEAANMGWHVISWSWISSCVEKSGATTTIRRGGRIAVRKTERAIGVRPRDITKRNGKFQVPMEPGQPEDVVDLFALKVREVEAEMRAVAEAEDLVVDGMALIAVATWTDAGAEHHLTTTSIVVPLAAVVEKSLIDRENQPLGTMLLFQSRDLHATVT